MPMSRPTMSPVRSFFLPGMPWMTCSLIETHREAGKWLYPRKAGSPPRWRRTSRAKSSSSAVLIPSLTSPASSWRGRARMALASRILESSAVFYVQARRADVAEPLAVLDQVDFLRGGDVADQGAGHRDLAGDDVGAHLAGRADGDLVLGLDVALGLALG